MSGYYTFENIDKQASKYLREVERYNRGWKIDRFKAGLIVVDMQEYFCDPESHAYIPSAEPIIQRIKKLQESFLTCNRPVFQTRHINNAQNARTMADWWADLINEGPISEISSKLRNEKVEKLVKSQYDAFWDTDLEKRLNDFGVKQVVITGVATHLCCESTARSAFMRGFEVFFAVDAVADFSEEFHRAAILNLAHGFAVPVHSKEILKELEVL